MALTVVILAAGQGKRMRSNKPKVLAPLAGVPLLAHVLNASRQLNPASLSVVVGHGGDAVRAAFPDGDINWVEQTEQLGTGHAVLQAIPGIPDDHQILILCGDVPLVRSETLARLVAAGGADQLGLLTARVDDPTGYGRIVRHAEGNVRAIVEQADASPTELAIDEINSGLMVLPAKHLRRWLSRLGNDNAQGEYYLTDCIAMAFAEQMPVLGIQAAADEVLGINDKAQLARVERLLQRARAEALMNAGVTLADPARIDVRGSLSCGRDVFIDINAVFEGNVTLADGVYVGPGAVIRDTTIGVDSVIHPQCVIEASRIGAGCQIGPFARLRPGADFADRSKAGNFVEVKQSVIGEGSKVNHLTYIGDTTIGQRVNVGAGTITCNYDGANKHRTVIGDGAFIGSGVELVAPVEIGAGATIGAGSTISKDAPADKLTLERAKQITLSQWKRPQKKT